MSAQLACRRLHFSFRFPRICGIWSLPLSCTLRGVGALVVVWQKEREDTAVLETAADTFGCALMVAGCMKGSGTRGRDSTRLFLFYSAELLPFPSGKCGRGRRTRNRWAPAQLKQRLFRLMCWGIIPRTSFRSCHVDWTALSDARWRAPLVGKVHFHPRFGSFVSDILEAPCADLHQARSPCSGSITRGLRPRGLSHTPVSLSMLSSLS